jgi:DnaK suppressor protein
MDSSHFRQILLELRKELAAVEKAGEQAAETVELDQTRVGRLSRMDALQNQAISIEVQRRREIQLRQIDKALSRLEAGEFGFCATCGEEISPGRLEFDPTATLCIECATKAENQEL